MNHWVLYLRSDSSIMTVNIVNEFSNLWKRRVFLHERAKRGAMDAHEKSCEIELQNPYR